MLYPITLKKNKGDWVAQAVGVSWAYSAGDTPEEAKNYLKWVLETGIAQVIKDKRTIKYLPTSYEKAIEMVKVYEGDVILSDVEIDLDKLSEFNKTERTNITIKKGYKAFIKAKGINLSKFIDEAIKKELSLS